MFGIPVLEVAAGLVFVYLLFSLLVSAVNEAILGHLIHLRCHVLEDGLRALLSNQGSKSSPLTEVGRTLYSILSASWRFFKTNAPTPAASPNLAERVMNHPLVTGLTMGGRKCPNYLPSNTFANAVVGTLLENSNQAKAPNVENLAAGIRNLNDPHGQKLLEGLLAGTKDLNEARQRLEE